VAPAVSPAFSGFTVRSPNIATAKCSYFNAYVAKWLGPLKKFTANQAKKAPELRDGAFWQNESYDRLVRSEEEFRRVRRYIEWNPVKAGCVQRPEQFRWSSAVAAWKDG
jgi:hypothetical protein